MQGKYLITTDHWFVAPDGKQYMAAWGTVEIMQDTFLGIKTNRNSTNWYLHVGSKEKGIIIAGCQVHYAIRCETKPSDGPGTHWETNIEHGCKVFDVPCRVYFAE